jgi:hypothetical protein
MNETPTRCPSKAGRGGCRAYVDWRAVMGSARRAPGHALSDFLPRIRRYLRLPETAQGEPQPRSHAVVYARNGPNHTPGREAGEQFLAATCRRRSQTANRLSSDEGPAVIQSIRTSCIGRSGSKASSSGIATAEPVRFVVAN